MRWKTNNIPKSFKFQQNNDVKEEEKREAFRVGKLKKDVWKSEAVQEKPKADQVTENVRVGKLKINAWSNSESITEQNTEKEQQVKLRGARRINKGNRISCLIENLHSDKKPDDSDEEANELSDTEEEVKLGHEMWKFFFVLELILVIESLFQDD